MEGCGPTPHFKGMPGAENQDFNGFHVEVFLGGTSITGWFRRENPSVKWEHPMKVDDDFGVAR